MKKTARIINSNPIAGVRLTVLSELTPDNTSHSESGEYQRFEGLVKHLVETPKPETKAKN